jgi:hypothetical protein
MGRSGLKLVHGIEGFEQSGRPLCRVEDDISYILHKTFRGEEGEGNGLL